MTEEPRQGGGEFKSSDLGSDLDIDEGLERGAAALRASGRLLYEDAELDRALVLTIVDAVFGPHRGTDEATQGTSPNRLASKLRMRSHIDSAASFVLPHSSWNRMLSCSST